MTSSEPDAPSPPAQLIPRGTVSSPFWTLYWIVLIGAIGAFQQWEIEPWWLKLALGAGMLWLFMQPIASRNGIRIGAEGISIGRTLPTFIPFRRLRKVEIGVSFWASRAVELTLDDDRVVRLVPGFLGKKRGKHCEALRDTIATALRAYEAQARRPLRSGPLARGGRSRQEWLDALRRIADPAYRDNTFTPEQLWDVLEDPSVEPTARAAAAHMLREEPENRPRIRVAAEAAAESKIRVALDEAASEAEMHEVETKLAKVRD
ncbi:MAG: hypothetical protein JRH11_01155 [Deltaproteobacteria bacterium]|nr:hypothetical protein [Deltaproteobacteria bacterium]